MHELTGHRDQVNSLEYSSKDCTLVSLGGTSQIIFWDTDSGRLKLQLYIPLLER